MKMAKTIFAKNPDEFIPALAAKLKEMEEFEIPEWACFAKSGVSRERPPVDDDFWYIRAASILRQLYIRGVVGVGRLRSRYGSRKDRGGRACKFEKSGGKIIRVILQQAEMAGLVEKISRMQHGRRLTQSGRDFLDSIEVEGKGGLDFDSVTAASPMATQVSDVRDQDSGDVEEDIKEEVKDEVARAGVPSEESKDGE